MKFDPFFVDRKIGLYSLGTETPMIGGMPFPRYSTPWRRIRDYGFQSLVNLTDRTAQYDPTPLKMLATVELEDLAGNRVPKKATTEIKKIVDVVNQICEEISLGRSVLIHCVGGTGRTGTVIACSLRNLGVDIDSVLATMDSVNFVRGRAENGWPESKWQEELVRNW